MTTAPGATCDFCEITELATTELGSPAVGAVPTGWWVTYGPCPDPGQVQVAIPRLDFCSLECLHFYARDRVQSIPAP